MAGSESQEMSEAAAKVVVIVLLGLAFGTALRFVEVVIVPALRSRIRGLVAPPFTLSVFLTGLMVSALVGSGNDEGEGGGKGGGEHGSSASHTGLFVESVRSAQRVDPEAVFLALLPPLIYESASSMTHHVWRRVRGQAIILAFPGVLIQVAVMGPVLRYLVGAFDASGPWDWNLSFLLASILTATDPVAVVATLHELGAPERLSNLIDGESLLNDGAAFVLFLIFKYNADQVAQGLPPHDAASGTVFFVQLSLGGIALGWAAFRCVIECLQLIQSDWAAEKGVILLGIYGSFALAELVLEVSGVLAVVTLGLLMAKRGNFAFSPETAPLVSHVVTVISGFCETIIFFVSGIVVWDAVFEGPRRPWELLPLLYAALVVARAGTVALLSPVLSRMGYRPSWKEGVVIVHAGLRGAVGLALSLLVTRDPFLTPEDRGRVHFLVAGFTALTLLINSPTMPPLMSALALYPANEFRREVVREAVAVLEGPAMEEVRAALSGEPALDARGAGSAAAATADEGAHALHKAACPWLASLAHWPAVLRLVPSLEGTYLQPDNRLHIPDTARTSVLDEELLRAAIRRPPRDVAASGQVAPAHAVPPALEMGDSGGRGRGSTARGPGKRGSAAFVFSKTGLGAEAEGEEASISDVERCEVVVELFTMLKGIYAGIRHEKQADGPALAVLVNAVAAAEELLVEEPERSAEDAFRHELQQATKHLYPVRPRWTAALAALPLVGADLAFLVEFDFAYQATEVLAGFVRAHDAVLRAVRPHRRRAHVAAEAVAIVLHEAQAELKAHLEANWEMVSVQLNVLTARAASEMKHRRAASLVAAGFLTAADLDQVDEVFRLSLDELDTLRHGVLPPIRIRRRIARLRRAVGGDGGDG